MSKTTTDNQETGKTALERVVSTKKELRHQGMQRCLEFIRSDIGFDKHWKTSELAELMGMNPESVAFGCAMSEISRELEREGYHLTTRGKSGQAYFATPVNKAHNVGDSMQREAIRLFSRAARYMHGVASNHADKLTDDEKRRLEKRAEIAALRYVFAVRTR